MVDSNTYVSFNMNNDHIYQPFVTELASHMLRIISEH